MSATIPFLIVNGVTSFTSIRVVNLEVLGTALVRESETVLGRITIRPAAGTIALNIRNATNTVDVIYFSEMGEGVVTGGIIAPSIGPAAGQKHTLPAVAADTIALLNAPQTLLNKTLGVTVLKDTDATPVADRQITVTDGLLRVRDMSGVEGRFISRLSLEPITDAEVNPAVVWPVNRIPNLDTSKITTGRFPLARMPDAPANTVLKGSGIGLDPVYGKIVDADIDPNAAISKTKISTVGQWPNTDIPVLTPDKYPDAVLRDGSRSFTGPPLLNFAGNTRIRFLSTDTGAVETVLGVESTSGLLKTFDTSLTEVRRISRLSLEPITNVEVDENASIAYSKLASLTPGSILFIGADGKITQDNENLFWDNVNKRLGIGTKTPTQTLHIERSVTGAARTMVMIKNTDTSISNLALLVIYSGASSNYTEIMKCGSEYTGVAGLADMSVIGGTGAGVVIRARNTNGILNFLTGGESFSGNSRMFITSTGDIGIGVTTPEFRLDVRGNSCVNRIANADSTNTLRNSFNLVLRGAYWNGSASANRDATIFHRMLSTTPTSEIVFQIAGVDMATLRDAIADGETALLIRRNVGGTYSLVRVSMGPPDSGGTGYRVLRVPN